MLNLTPPAYHHEITTAALEVGLHVYTEKPTAHFVVCLRGEEQPELTAEHAIHVLEIMTKAQESAGGGGTLALDTTFERAPADPADQQENM